MSLRVKAANDRQAFWLLADGFFRVSPAIIPMTTESNISAGRGLPDYQFSSGLASALFRCLPKARGASLVGALLFKVLPIDPAVIMRAGDKPFRLDLRYRSHLATLRSTERAETAFLMGHLMEGDVFFDLGSNWGYFTAVASSIVGPLGLVVAVEADPRVFARLVSLVSQSGLVNVLPLNFALSDVSGQSLTITHAWYRNDTGGFIRPGAPEGKDAGVVSKNLDDLWRQLGRPNVRMVKIDVEGVEPLVLRGGETFFSQGVADFVQVEVSEWDLQRSGVHHSHIYELMGRSGFHYAYRMSFREPDLLLRTIQHPDAPVGCNVLFSRRPIDS